MKFGHILVPAAACALLTLGAMPADAGGVALNTFSGATVYGATGYIQQNNVGPCTS